MGHNGAQFDLPISVLARFTDTPQFKEGLEAGFEAPESTAAIAPERRPARHFASAANSAAAANLAAFTVLAKDMQRDLSAIAGPQNFTLQTRSDMLIAGLYGLAGADGAPPGAKVGLNYSKTQPGMMTLDFTNVPPGDVAAIGGRLNRIILETPGAKGARFVAGSDPAHSSLEMPISEMKALMPAIEAQLKTGPDMGAANTGAVDQFRINILNTLAETVKSQNGDGRISMQMDRIDDVLAKSLLHLGGADHGASPVSMKITTDGVYQDSMVMNLKGVSPEQAKLICKALDRADGGEFADLCQPGAPGYDVAIRVPISGMNEKMSLFAANFDSMAHEDPGLKKLLAENANPAPQPSFEQAQLMKAQYWSDNPKM
jgi:hypothetical protein